MADIKWIKLATNMHDDEKMKLIDAMPERDTIHYLWIRLLIQAGKTNANGFIYLNENIPYTDEMLATIFSRPLGSIRLALKVLSDFQMIEIAKDNVIRIVNWEKHQNIEGMERVREQNRKRAENHREKKKLEKKASKNSKENDESIDLDEAEDLKKNDIYENKQKDDFETNEKKSMNSFNESKIDSEDYDNNSNYLIEVNSNEMTNLDSIKNNKDKVNIIQKSNNITKNQSNVTLTQQNKKEIQNKKKKKEIESKCKNTTYALNNKSSTSEGVSQSDLFEDNTKSKSADEEDINLKALELMHYHEKITGKVGGCDYVALRSAIDTHGEKRVKMAMDIGFEKNCEDIKYAIGVLKNWRREGYPNDDKEVKKNGVRSYGKNIPADKNEFAGFKPKEPRKLTEAERKRIEASLI